MKQFFLILFVLGLAVTPAFAQEPTTITVIAHDSFAYSEDVIEAFQAETGITVEVLRVGDTGTLVNQAVLTANNPLGDVIYGVDNTFLSRALAGEIFTPYQSPLLENVPVEFQIDEEYRVTPINYGDVCLNYDVAYFEENDLALPQSLADLTEPQYASLLVVENPATSSPGLAFLLASISVFGEEGDYTYLDFWADLVANDVHITADWTSAYYGEFSGSAGSEGDRPLVVSYASSPPAEVYFAEEPTDTAPTSTVIADETCFRQIEFAGILNGTQNEAAAQQFIDFLLSVPLQEDLPLQMFVFPVNEAAQLPEVFEDFAPIPDNPITVDIEAIDANRDTWIQTWTETVLR